MKTSNTFLSVNTKKLAQQRKTQHSFACSGSGERSSWTWEALWCYPWKLLCCSPCTSTLFVAETNGLPRNTASTAQQENPSSPSLIPGGPSSQGCREQAVGWEIICASAPYSHPSFLLMVLWLLPPPSTSCMQVPRHPRPCPRKHCSPHTWRSSAVLKSGSSHVAREEAGASCPSPTSMTQCEAWELLLWDTKAWQLIKAGERFKKDYSTENYHSRFNFPVEIIQWTSLPISSRSAVKTVTTYSDQEQYRRPLIKGNQTKAMVTKSRTRTRKQSTITFLSE